MLFFILSSCSIQKFGDNPLNDFINTEFSTKYDTIFISSRKTPSDYVISVYERGYKNRDEKLYKPVHAFPNPSSWPLDTTGIRQLKKVAKDKDMDNKAWTKRNFNFNVIIIPQDYYKTKLIHDNNNRVLYLSEPVFNNEKDVALFSYAVARPGMLRNTYERYVLVMIKRDGKWHNDFKLWEEIYD